MPELHTFRNKKTGESVTFNWSGKGKPTIDDVRQIRLEQAKSKAASIQEASAAKKEYDSNLGNKLTKVAGKVQDVVNYPLAGKPSTLFTPEGDARPPESDESGIMKVGRSLAQTAYGMATPGNIALLPLTAAKIPALAKAAVPATFMTQSASHLPEQAEQVYNDPNAYNITNLATNVAMTGLMGKAAVDLAAPRVAPPTPRPSIIGPERQIEAPPPPQKSFQPQYNPNQPENLTVIPPYQPKIPSITGQEVVYEPRGTGDIIDTEPIVQVPTPPARFVTDPNGRTIEVAPPNEISRQLSPRENFLNDARVESLTPEEKAENYVATEQEPRLSPQDRAPLAAATFPPIRSVPEEPVNLPFRQSVPPQDVQLPQRVDQTPRNLRTEGIISEEKPPVYPKVESPIVDPNYVGGKTIEPEIFNKEIKAPEPVQVQEEPLTDKAKLRAHERAEAFKGAAEDVRNKVPFEEEPQVEPRVEKPLTLRQKLEQARQRVNPQPQIEEPQVSPETKSRIDTIKEAMRRIREKTEPQTPKVESPKVQRGSDYTQALDRLEPNETITHRILVRAGIKEGMSLEDIATDLIDNTGISEADVMKYVTKEAKVMKGEGGKISIDKEDIKKVKELGSDLGNKAKEIGSDILNTLRTTSAVLKESKDPNAKIIGESIPQQYDQERYWVNNTKIKTAKVLQDLSQKEREQVGHILNGEDIEASSQVKEAAVQTRVTLDSIKDFLEQREQKFNMGFKRSGERMGTLSDYYTHMKKLTPDNLLDAMKGFLSPRKESIHYTGMYDDDIIGVPRFGSAETRTAREYPLEYDPNIVLGKYIEGAGRIAFRKPTVASLTSKLDQIPSGDLREMAVSYLKSYASSNEYASSKWDRLTRPLMNINSRTLMLANPRLWLLHLGRIGNVYQELGNKYTAIGIKNLSTNFWNKIREAKNDGLVPGFETGPTLFPSLGQKVTRVMAAYNIADAIPDVIAREGFKAKFRDQGMKPNEINMRALTAGKDAGLRVDPTRQAELFSRYLQGPAKPMGQYKQIQFKIAEQYYRNTIGLIGKDIPFKDKVAMLSRVVVSTAVAIGLTKGLGITVFHLRGSAFSLLSAASLEMPYSIAKKLLSDKKKDFDKGVEDFLTYMTPGGWSARSQIRKGEPSFFEAQGQKKDMKIPFRWIGEEENELPFRQ